jgi:hypothetical protein
MEMMDQQILEITEMDGTDGLSMFFCPFLINWK